MFTGNQRLLVNTSVGIPLAQKQERFALLKGSELDKLKQLLIENEYPADVLLYCITQKLANFAAEKTFGQEKCPVYLKLPWIGNVSSKFENQTNKAITSCFYAVKPYVVYSSRVMLPSAKKDSAPTTQKNCVAYEFSCRCEARYVGSTTQKPADRIILHVPTSIRKKSDNVREQPPHLCINNNSKINCDSAIGQHLLTNQECAKTLGKQDRPFIYVLWNLFISKLKTQSCANRKISFFHLESSCKQWKLD